MRDKIAQIKKHILRSWKVEDNIHPALRVLPPFLLELIAYLIAVGILYQVGAYLWRFI
jgi:hypothetical protein